jgi:thymidylate synthase ThyX
MSFDTQPVVKLEGVITQPYDLAVATARTCYSSKGIIKVADVSATEKSRVLRDKIADSTREAGHLTTRQHAHFVFSLDKVSRQFIWSFLHSHPYYNSEQVSQRYVKVAPGNYTVPNLPAPQKKRFIAALDAQVQDYQQLIELSLPEIEKRYFAVFPFRKTTADKYKPALLKRAYEVARYALGVATHAYLYHTVSALTLMRYYRLSHGFEATEETRMVVQMMVDEVVKIDPLFAKDLIDPVPLEQTDEYKLMQAFKCDLTAPVSHEFISEFDASLDGRYALLTDYKINAETSLADSVRSVFGLTRGQMSDDAALEALLNPAINKSFSDTLNINTLSKLNRTMFHPHYTFRKKISHTADSQDQRHRMVPGSRPILWRHYTGQPDYIVPMVIKENDTLHDAYRKSMTRSFSAINELLNDGVKPDDALYLLPNAFPIRFEESGDLLNLHHKWKARSCYTAQEEIYFATLDELEQVKAVHPRIARHILAPCYLRKAAGVKPYCPEGDRFCGVRVWQQDLDAYRGRTL